MAGQPDVFGQRVRRFVQFGNVNGQRLAPQRLPVGRKRPRSPRKSNCPHGPRTNMDQPSAPIKKGTGMVAPVRGEHGSALAVDHRVNRAATIKLMFAFAQSVHRGVRVKTHAPLVASSRTNSCSRLPSARWSGNRQRLRLDGEAHFSHQDVRWSSEVTPAEFFRGWKGDKRGGGRNGARLSLLIQRGDRPIAPSGRSLRRTKVSHGRRPK